MNYSACMSSMIDDGLFDKIFAGYLITAFLICYGAGQLINGLVGNHISPRIMISTGFIGAATANLFMALIPNKYALLIIWGLCGYFSSMFWSSIIRTFSEWLPDSKRYRAGLFISLTIPIGTILSYLMSSITLKISNWKTTFISSAIVLIIALIVWIVGQIAVKNYWNITDTENRNRRNEIIKSGEKYKDIPLIKIILTTGLFAAIFTILFTGALKEPVINMIPRYLKEQFNISSSFASLLSIILPVISIPGAFVATYLNNKFFKNEIKTCSFMFIIAALAMGLTFFFNQFSVLLAAILTGFSISAMWGVNTMLLTFIPYHFNKIGKSSSITGLLNCCAQISSAAFSTIYAYSSVTIGWNNTVLIWACLAAGGMFISISFAHLWAKNRSKFE